MSTTSMPATKTFVLDTSVLLSDPGAMGRFAEPGLWILGALGRGPLRLSGLFDVVVSIPMSTASRVR